MAKLMAISLAPMGQDIKYSRVRVGRPAGRARPGNPRFATFDLMLTITISITILTYRLNVAKPWLPGRARPAGLPTRTREYLISWPMDARLMAISRRLVAI